ncbi:cold shock CspA family protein [Bradyrhizobium sp. cir1]|nr:cold shock CspA family protein [Bradyrhizobium sp. cir1]
MAMGIVKWFNPTKGHGFIGPADGGPDVIVHISAVERAAYTTVEEGAAGKLSAQGLAFG